MLKEFLPRGGCSSRRLQGGQAARPLLPPACATSCSRRAMPDLAAREHARKMLVLAGCVQPAMAPDINAATARVLDSLGVQLIEAPKAGCCGACAST
jgi:glycolate oxidase iron-sulfur subunit